MFWLSGHTHSGTTLLQTLLDGHPECLVYPVEPYFYASFSRDADSSPVQVNLNFLFKAHNQLHCSWESAGFKPRITQDETFDFEQISGFLQEAAKTKKIIRSNLEHFDHATFFQVYYSKLLEEMNKNPGGDRKFNVDAAFLALQAAVTATVPELKFGSHMTFKQPLGQLRPGMTNWFFKNWPDGKIVFLRRNPYARIWSHIRHETDFDRPSVRWSSDKNAFLKLVKWYARDYVQSLALPDNDKILKIRYEVLATQPEATMKRVCGFLGIEYSENCLKSSVFGFDSNPSTNRTGKNAINASSLHRWKENLTATEKAVIGYHISRAYARRIYRPQSAKWSV